MKVLQDCIRVAGSTEGGLKSYVGAANTQDDGGYTGKVMAEYARLKQVALGRSVPVTTPAPMPTAENTITPEFIPEKTATLAMR